MCVCACARAYRCVGVCVFMWYVSVYMSVPMCVVCVCTCVCVSERSLCVSVNVCYGLLAEYLHFLQANLFPLCITMCFIRLKQAVKIFWHKGHWSKSCSCPAGVLVFFGSAGELALTDGVASSARCGLHLDRMHKSNGCMLCTTFAHAMDFTNRVVRKLSSFRKIL